MLSDLDISAEIQVATSTKKRRVAAKPTVTKKKKSVQKKGKETLGASISEFDQACVTKKRSLRKKEKEALGASISESDQASLSAAVLQEVDRKYHLQVYPERSELWEKLKISDSFFLICECLKKLYVDTYESCSTGADKYAKFQLKWYQECSSMLFANTCSDKCHPCLSEATKKWTQFLQANGASHYHSSTIMISIQGAVFEQLAKEVSKEIPCVSDTNTPHCLSDEREDVYYRFGGGAIAEMLHNRYKGISSCPCSKRNKIIDEIAMLKAMECKDKSAIPASLQYRDRGFMYFPDPSLIPFIKAVDNKVRTIANNIIEIASKSIKEDVSFCEHFVRFLETKYDSLEDISEVTESIFNEFIRKLYNTRLVEFMDTYRQSQASQKGSATLTGQNIRDALLSQHVNLKTIADI